MTHVVKKYSKPFLFVFIAYNDAKMRLQIEVFTVVRFRRIFKFAF